MRGFFDFQRPRSDGFHHNFCNVRLGVTLLTFWRGTVKHSNAQGDCSAYQMKGANMKAHWLRRLLVLFIEHTKPTTEQAIITHADAKAIRRTVLGRLTTFERAFLWRWCISMAVIYAGLFAVLLLVMLVLATHASL